VCADEEHRATAVTEPLANEERSSRIKLYSLPFANNPHPLKQSSLIIVLEIPKPLIPSILASRTATGNKFPRTPLALLFAAKLRPLERAALDNPEHFPLRTKSAMIRGKRVSSHILAPNTESAILARILQADEQKLTPDRHSSQALGPWRGRAGLTPHSQQNNDHLLRKTLSHIDRRWQQRYNLREAAMAQRISFSGSNWPSGSRR
jgi:hypothetical protein